MWDLLIICRLHNLRPSWPVVLPYVCSFKAHHMTQRNTKVPKVWSASLSTDYRRIFRTCNVDAASTKQVWGGVSATKSLPSAHRTKSARWQRPEAPDQLTHVNNFADWLCSSLPSILIKNELDISFVYLCLNLYLCICVFDCVCCMCICVRIHVCTLKTQSQRSTKKLSTSKLPVSYRALSLRTSKDKIKIKARPRD